MFHQTERYPSDLKFVMFTYMHETVSAGMNPMSNICEKKHEKRRRNGIISYVMGDGLVGLVAHY